MLSPALKPETQLWSELNTLIKKSEDHVLKAARIYYDIKVRFKSGEFGKGLSWKDYVAQNSPYSLERVKQLLQIANDPDPEQKLKKIREKNRRNMQIVRADRVTRVTPEIPEERVLRSTFPETSEVVPEAVERGATWVEDGKSVGTWHPNVRDNWSCANRGLTPPPVETWPRSIVSDIQNRTHKELVLTVLYLKRSKIWPKIEKLLSQNEENLMEQVQ